MSRTIKVDPVTRLEGHLSITIEVEEGKVSKAFSSGEMFRGFETILRGRAPLDAQQITQRICGVCPVSHGTASVFAQESAYKVIPAENGRILRNLILGANYLQSHIIHFYQLSALDFIDVASILEYAGKDPLLTQLKGWALSQSSTKTIDPLAPFLPRYEADYSPDATLNLLALRHYVEALEIRKLAHQAVAIFAGKIPHAPALIPGGVSTKPLAPSLAAYRSRLERIQRFIDEAYLPDLKEIAKVFPQYLSLGASPGAFLSYGAFPQKVEQSQHLFPAGVLINGRLAKVDTSRIRESTASSFFETGPALHPGRGETKPAPGKNGAYSWVKAPRYDGIPLEVGPMPRLMVALASGGETAKHIRNELSSLEISPEQLNSALGRHAARAIESRILARHLLESIDEANPEKPSSVDFSIPMEGAGEGLMEAPRGALGHWIELKGGLIERYQCVVPTTWNCSPRDESGTAGPVEYALEGVRLADPENPIEVVRIIRSFDPCLACAVH